MSNCPFQATVNSVVVNVNSVVTVNSVVGISAEQKTTLLTLESIKTANFESRLKMTNATEDLFTQKTTTGNIIGNSPKK